MEVPSLSVHPLQGWQLGDDNHAACAAPTSSLRTCAWHERRASDPAASFPSSRACLSTRASKAAQLVGSSTNSRTQTCQS
jgi:hypothetical protein